MNLSRFFIAVSVFAALSLPAMAQVPVMENAPPSVSKLAAGLLDAVVNISSSQTIKGTEQGDNTQTPDMPDGAPFQDYFKDFFSADKNSSKEQSRKLESLGSGFVIDAKEGLIVTNNHVIDKADTIEVNFSDGSKLAAKLLGKDVKTDIALLKVDPSEKALTAIHFGDSEAAKIGDWVMAIGNPFGLGGTVTVGIISARNRDINAGPYDDFIQTDAAINRGNSGGPLFNMKGEVIGINTAIISPTGGSIGLGFAIPSELAVSVIDQLREYGETRRGWLAVRIQPVTQEIATRLGLAKAKGALIAGRIEDAKVDNNAIHTGDIILRFGDRDVKEARDLPRIVAESPVNHLVTVVVWRDGKEQKVDVKLGLLKEKEAAETAEEDEGGKKEKNEKPQAELMGLTLAPLTPELRKEYSIAPHLNGVVIINVRLNSAADDKRLRKGDVIIDIGQEKVATLEDVKKRLDALRNMGRKNALFLVARPSGELRFVTVPMD